MRREPSRPASATTEPSRDHSTAQISSLPSTLAAISLCRAVKRGRTATPPRGRSWRPSRDRGRRSERDQRSPGRATSSVVQRGFRRAVSHDLRASQRGTDQSRGTRVSHPHLARGRTCTMPPPRLRPGWASSKPPPPIAYHPSRRPRSKLPPVAAALVGQLSVREGTRDTGIHRPRPSHLPKLVGASTFALLSC